MHDIRIFSLALINLVPTRRDDVAYMYVDRQMAYGVIWVEFEA